MVDTHAAVLARAVELKEENEKLKGEMVVLKSWMQEVLTILKAALEE